MCQPILAPHQPIFLEALFDHTDYRVMDTVPKKIHRYHQIILPGIRQLVRMRTAKKYLFKREPRGFSMWHFAAFFTTSTSSLIDAGQLLDSLNSFEVWSNPGINQIEHGVLRKKSKHYISPGLPTQ
jgi:hypothetical protein